MSFHFNDAMHQTVFTKASYCTKLKFYWGILILFNILIDRGQKLVQNVENIQPRLFQPSPQKASFWGGNLIFELCPFIGMLLKGDRPQRVH